MLKMHCVTDVFLAGLLQLSVKVFPAFSLKVVYFPAIFLRYMYIISWNRSIENTLNSSTQVPEFRRPYQRLKYQLQTNLPLSV